MPRPHPLRRATPTPIEAGAMAFAGAKAEKYHGAPSGTHDGVLSTNLVRNTVRSYLRLLSEMLDSPGAERLSELTGRKVYIVERMLADRSPFRKVYTVHPRGITDEKRAVIIRMAGEGAGAARIAQEVGLGGAIGRQRVYGEIRRLVDSGELPSRPLQRRRQGSAGSTVGLE